MKDEPPIIEVKGLRKIFGEGDEAVLALDDVSFSVQKGEFVSIVGASGCGKSTLLNIIAGLIQKTDGEVTVEGKPVRAPLGNVGMVFQSPVLLPWRRVMNNVLLPIEIYRLDGAKYLKIAQDLIEFTGLKGFESKYPFELSGGMQQRVSLCRALLTDPELLLMDEPFGALDAITREKMNLELLRIWSKKRKTVLFVTHSIQEAVFLSDNVVVMTQRPGKVAYTLRNDLPRPRDPKTFADPKFSEYTIKVRDAIGLTSVGVE